SEEKLKGIMKEHQFKRYSISYDELLNDNEVDTVYVALPNHLHYSYALQALEHHKNVILEKPFTTTLKEAIHLKEIAIKNQLFLWEAITNQYFPNFDAIKSRINDLGNIKIVECNFSQYSSRYNAFKEGNILPAFDYTKAGGALMDLNIYNIHFVVGLFGKPTEVQYYPNVEKGIDTSGVLILDYDKFKCICIGAKDCKAPLSNNIQGDKGCIHVSSSLSIMDSFDIFMNDGSSENVNINNDTHRMSDEFMAFEKMYKNNDYQECYKMLEHSMIVTEVQTVARRKAGILFPEDEIEI
ncbi:MAG: Gfo/Idh/MocA family oxidoreductase, partial [Coprobacillus sp.]